MSIATGQADPRTTSRFRVQRRALVPLVTLLVAVAVGYGLLILRDHADSRRQGEVLLARLESLSTRQGSLQWQAVGEQQLSVELESQVRTVRTRLAELFVELAKVTPDSDTILAVQGAVDAYERSVDEILRILAQGRVETARTLLVTQTDPAYRNLTALIDAESARYRDMASRSGSTADLGALSALLSGAVLILLLYRRFDRDRRDMMLQVGEERGLRQGEARFRSLVQHSSDTITVVDPDGGIRYQSPSVERLLGFAPDTLVGRPLFELAHPDDAGPLWAVLQEIAETDEPQAVEWRVRNRDGTWLHVESRVTDMSSDLTVSGFVLNTRDITDRKALEDRLAHRANYDSLTELPNRALFRERLEHALSDSRRSGGKTAVLFLDLDGFKTVNDTLGHGAGDELLTLVAERLRVTVGPLGTVARLAGDEFAILLPSVESPEAPRQLAAAVVEALQQPVALEGREFWVSASVGVALSGSAVPSGSDLLRNADLAMYAAKANGKGRFEVFDAQMHTSLVQHVELETALRQAMERKELALAYQPIVSLEDGRIVSFEALLRWDSPDLGTIEPAVVVAAAETSGLIVQLGREVLGQACAEAAGWSNLVRREPPGVTVNISSRELEEADFVEHLHRTLQRTGLRPHRLTLEITESVMARDIDRMADMLKEVRLLGVRVAMDDFGTGYSSLGLIHRLPLDVLKFDRAFVAQGPDGETPPEFLGSIMALGRSLGIRTVAEGIETPRQLARLRELGCELGQGYLIQPPVPALALPSLIGRGSLEVPGSRPAPKRPEAVKRVS
jgi:diguanylate cyclase (GGDEF)-like protein/PAS domain S-box-containing protein